MDLLDGPLLFARVQTLIDGLRFDQLGSEGDQPCRAVRFVGPIPVLDAASFRAALDRADAERGIAAVGQSAVERIVPGDEVLDGFIETMRLEVFPDGSGDRAAALVAAMRENLRDIAAVVVAGEGKKTAAFPVYVVGVARDDSVVGFASEVIWT